MYAKLEPRIGVPTQAEALFQYVEKHITTEGEWNRREMCADGWMSVGPQIFSF